MGHRSLGAIDINPAFKVHIPAACQPIHNEDRSCRAFSPKPPGYENDCVYFRRRERRLFKAIASIPKDT